MKKIWTFGLVVAIAFAFIGTSIVEASCLVEVRGIRKRVNTVTPYLSQKNFLVVKAIYTEKEKMVELNGKLCPGVLVTSGPDSEIRVPVSDKVVEEGLCDKQKELLDGVKCSTTVSTPAVPVVPIAPSKIRVKKAVVETKDCDERSFSGRVTTAVLAHTNGQPADALEFHFRPYKDEQYKVKRGHVDKKGVFNPMIREDKSCMREYAGSEKAIFVKANRLLFQGEYLEQVMEEGKGGKTPFTNHEGLHNTIAVFVIR